MSSPLASGRRPLLAVAGVAAAALLLAGCAGTAAGGPTSASSKTGGVYSLGLQAPDGNIDPFTTADSNSMFIVGLANAGLINQDASGKLVPQLATAWTPAADGLSWTIALRQGAKFSDGTAITAKDVVATFDSILGDKSQSPAKSSFAGIVKSVAAGADGASVVFSLDRTYSDFPYLLTGANTNILPAGIDDTKWLDHPVGAGQFILSAYTPGQGVTYKKNPNYWDAEHVDLAGIDVKFYADAQSSLLAFQNGEIDQINNSPAVTAAVDVSKYRHADVGYMKFDALTFNVTTAPFDDPAVRQAVAWALDRKAIVQTVYGGDADVANDDVYFPDYAVQPQGLTQRKQDAAKVKSLLGGRTISFTITTYDGEKTLAELIQQQLNAIGGFDVKLQVLTSAQYYADGASTPWLNAPVTITDWGKRLPSQYLGLIYGTGSDWNAAHYSSPELEKVGAEFDATTDKAKRQTLTDQIAKIQWTDVPVVVTAFKREDLILGTAVSGEFAHGQNFDGGYDFRGISVHR